MTNYTDDELEVMLIDLESDTVERKRSAADRSAIRRTIAAFANDLAGHGRAGVIFIGAEDDGGCSNLPVSDEMLSILAQMRSDGNILPLPSLLVQKRSIAGCEMAVIIVAPSSDPPVRYQGRVYVKIGPTVQAASAEEERILAERRQASALSFDRRPAAGAALDELDLDYFRSQFLPRAIPPDVIDQNRRPLEQQLESLRLTVRGTPTNGSMIVLGRDPQRWIPGAYVQFLRIDGQEITDPIRDQKQLTGRLEDVLRRLDELLEINISVRTDITSETREIRRPDYPIVAVQQLARNAVMHRNYDGTNAPVRVFWYSDRIEIQSPGGLYGQVTAANFGQGVTDYRNPSLAEAMHHLGFAQRFGLGIPLARRELEQNGNPPPRFDFQPTMVGVTIGTAQ
jgi:ATP-dependent DNA helicase RecG